MVKYYCIISLLSYAVTYSIQESKYKKNSINNYLNAPEISQPNTSNENYFDDNYDLLSFLLENENSNTDNIMNNNQNTTGYNSMFNPIGSNAYEDTNVFEFANPQNIYNSRYNPETHYNIQHNLGTIPNNQHNLQNLSISQYIPQNTNNLSSTESNLQMNDFYNVRRNYFNNSNDLQPFNYFNENPNPDITLNDNQNNMNYNPIYYQMNVSGHENIDNMNVFGPAHQENFYNNQYNIENFHDNQYDPQSIYNSRYNPEDFYNNQFNSQNIYNSHINPEILNNNQYSSQNFYNSHYNTQNIYNSHNNPENFHNNMYNQETIYNSQYNSENFNNNQFDPQYTNTFSSPEGNLQMNDFSSVGENYFTNGIELQPLNYFNENPNPDITLNDNQNNMNYNPIYHQMRVGGYGDISSNNNAAPESSNHENLHDYFVSFANNLRMEDDSNDSENSSEEVKNENSLPKNIITTNFKNPKEVKSSDIYQLILKFISAFVYLERPLSSMSFLLYRGLSELYSYKNVSKDQLESRLISLVDILILFNKKNKEPNFKILTDVKRKFYYKKNRHNRLKKTEKFDIVKFWKDKKFKCKEYLGAKEYAEIWKDLRYIANYKNIFEANIVSLCVFFHYISKINEYYNKNMRKKVHKHLIKILLSITKNDEMNIDCSKYTSNNNFIAYWIFELFLQCEFQVNDKGSLYNYSRLNLKLMQPNFHMIVFLFLNTPESIRSLMLNSHKLEKLEQKIQEEFLEIQYVISAKEYIKPRRAKALEIENFTNSKLHENIDKTSDDINDNFLGFYEFVYKMLAKNINE